MALGCLWEEISGQGSMSWKWHLGNPPLECQKAIFGAQEITFQGAREIGYESACGCGFELAGELDRVQAGFDRKPLRSSELRRKGT